MQSKRALLLASTALASLSSLGYVTEANAAVACVPGAGTLVCSGADVSSAIQVLIDAQPNPPPNLLVTFDATLVSDNTKGGIQISNAKHAGTVGFVNAGTVGLMTANGLATFPANGLLIIGDPTLSTNIASITNNKDVFGAVAIGSALASAAGGTGTITNSGLIAGAANIFSVGNATLTSAGKIYGAVKVQSENVTDTSVGGVDGFTVGKDVGGTASVTVGADVGALADTTKAEDGDGASATYNPFTAQSITVTAKGGSASATISAKAAGVTIDAASVGTVTGTVTSGSGTTTKLVKNNTFSLAGKASATIAATGNIGALSVTGFEAADATIDGKTGAVTLNANRNNTVSETTTINDSVTDLSVVVVTATVSGGGSFTAKVGAGGQVQGGMTLSGDTASTLTVDGLVGALDTDGTVKTAGTTTVDLSSGTKTVTATTTNIAGPITTGTSSKTEFVDQGGAFTLNVGATGAIYGGVQVKTGGDFTAAISGQVGNQTVAGNGLDVDATWGEDSNWSNNRTITSETSYDTTGAIKLSEKSTNTLTAAGGKVDLTIAATGKVVGTISLWGDGPVTFSNAGTVGTSGVGAPLIAGTTVVEATRGSQETTNDSTFSFLSSNVPSTSTTTETTKTDTKTVNKTLGSSATFGNTGAIYGSVTVTALDDISATNKGLIRGAASLTAAGTSTTVVASNTKIVVDAPVDPLLPLVKAKSTTLNLVTSNTTASATGGKINLLVASGAKITGLTTATADGGITFANDGSLGFAGPAGNHSGTVLLTSARSLTTTNNVVTTDVTLATVGTTNTTVTKSGSKNSVIQTVGGAITASNTSLTSIIGNFTAAALGDVNFTNPGFVSGDVTLSSLGTSVLSATANSSTVVEARIDPVDATKGYTNTTTVDDSVTGSGTNIGGKVVGTYAGVVGVDNLTVGIAANFPAGTVGTFITQASNKDSIVTVSSGARLFEGIKSYAGVINTSGTLGFDTTTATTTKSTLALTQDKAKVAVSGTFVTASTKNTTSTALKGASTIAINGAMSKDSADKAQAILARAPTTASVTVTGVVVEGAVTAQGYTDVNNVFASSSSASYSIDKLGLYTETAFASADKSVDTRIGGSSNVLVTGASSRVRGLVSADASGSALVQVDATGRVDAGVSSTVTLGNDTTTTNSVARVYGAGGVALNYTQTTTSATSNVAGAVGKDAVATLNGRIAGAVTVTNTGAGNATATLNPSSTSSVITNLSVLATTGTSVIASTNTVLTGVNAASALNAQPGAVATSGFGKQTDFTTTKTRMIGGAATANLTAVAVFANGLTTDLVMSGNATITGDKSATLNVGAGARVGTVGSANTIVVTSLPIMTSSTVSETYAAKDASTAGTSLKSSVTTVDNARYVGGVDKTVMGGAATLTNAGELRASITVNAAGGANAITFTNSGRVGSFGQPTNPIGNMFTNILLDALQTDFGTVTTTTNSTPGDQGGLKSVKVETRTSVGGTVLANNTGFLYANAQIEAGTGTLNNKAGAAVGGVTFGQVILLQDVRTTTYTPTSGGVAGAVSTFPTPLFNQNYTLNQDGLLNGGVLVTGATIDGLGNGTKSSNVTATVNLGNNSVTLGDIDGLRNLSTGAAVVALNVNMNGAGFLGLNTSVFDEVLPTLSGTQLEFLGLNPARLTKTSPLFGGVAANASIRRATNVTHAGTGTFYIVGSGFDNQNTAQTNDNLYDIQASGAFTNTSGELQFNLSSNTGQRFGISGATVNNGTWVLGARDVTLLNRNLAANLSPSVEFVDNIDFRHDGNFTNGATGTIVTSILPGVLRNAPAIGSNTAASELLALPGDTVSIGYFTSPERWFGPSGTQGNANVLVNGNLTLGGKVEVQTLRNGLYAGGDSIPVWTVNGTVTLNSPVVTIAGGNASPFLGFKIATKAVTATQNVVSIDVTRKGYESAATDANAAAAGVAFNGDLTYNVGRILKDANTSAAGPKVFPLIQDFRDAQDMANTFSAMDWSLTAAQSGALLSEVSGSGAYGSALALNHTAPLTDAIEHVVEHSAAMTQPGTNVWIAPTARTTKLGGDSETGAGDLRSNEVGVTFGADWRINQNFGLGLAGGFSAERLQETLSGDVDTWMAGAFAYYAQGPIHVGAQFNYGNSNFSTDRDLATMTRTAHANFNGNTTVVKGEVGYDFPLMMAGVVTPFLALEHRSVSTQGFEETGAGGVGLAVDDASASATNPQLGLRWMGSNLITGQGFNLTPTLEAGYIFGNTFDTGSTARFIGGNNGFSTEGIEASGFGRIQAGLFGTAWSNAMVGVKGGYDFGSTVSSSSITAVLKFTLGGAN